MKNFARLIYKTQQPAVKGRPAVLTRKTRPVNIEYNIKQVLNAEYDKQDGMI